MFAHFEMLLYLNFCQRQSVKKSCPLCFFKYSKRMESIRNVIYLIIKHITGIHRSQMCFSSLEDTITSDNPIRFINVFFQMLSRWNLLFLQFKLY